MCIQYSMEVDFGDNSLMRIILVHKTKCRPEDGIGVACSTDLAGNNYHSITAFSCLLPHFAPYNYTHRLGTFILKNIKLSLFWTFLQRRLESMWHVSTLNGWNIWCSKFAYQGIPWKMKLLWSCCCQKEGMRIKTHRIRFTQKLRNNLSSTIRISETIANIMDIWTPDSLPSVLVPLPQSHPRDKA